MSAIIIAISLWCGGLQLNNEVKACRKELFKCVKENVSCSNCWAITIKQPIYDAALSICIEKSL